MSRPTRPDLPEGYPDPAASGWVRTDDFTIADLDIRMTVAPGERIVELWELVDGHPVQWVGNVFRVDAEPPCVYMNHTFERLLTWVQRDSLARAGAKFWKN